jgi:hypothetical protein
MRLIGYGNVYVQVFVKKMGHHNNRLMREENMPFCNGLSVAKGCIPFSDNSYIRCKINIATEKPLQREVSENGILHFATEYPLQNPNLQCKIRYTGE